MGHQRGQIVQPCVQHCDFVASVAAVGPAIRLQLDVLDNVELLALVLHELLLARVVVVSALEAVRQPREGEQHEDQGRLPHRQKKLPNTVCVSVYISLLTQDSYRLNAKVRDFLRSRPQICSKGVSDAIGTIDCDHLYNTRASAAYTPHCK